MVFRTITNTGKTAKSFQIDFKAKTIFYRLFNDYNIMEKRFRKELDKEIISIVLLFLALVIMLIGFIITELFFV